MSAEARELGRLRALVQQLEGEKALLDIELRRLRFASGSMHTTTSQEIKRKGRILPQEGYANKVISGWEEQFLNIENTDIGTGALVEPLKRSSQCIVPSGDGNLKIAICGFRGHDESNWASVEEELKVVTKIASDPQAKVELFVRPNATKADIQDALAWGCSVLILGGHHNEAKGFEVADGHLEDARLIKMVEASSVNMLVFTFCFAETLANHMVRQVPHVYAVFSLSHELGLDDAAASLTGTALDHFIQGKDVIECFKAAVLRLTALKDQMTVGVFKRFEATPSQFVSLRCKAVERVRTTEERLDRIEVFLRGLSYLERCVFPEQPQLKAAFLESEHQYEAYGAGWLPYRNTLDGKLHIIHYAPGVPFIHVGNRPDDEEWAYRCAIYQTQLCFTRLLTSERIRGEAKVHPFTMAFLNFPEGYEGRHTVKGYTPCLMSKAALYEFNKVDANSLSLSEVYDEELEKLRREYREVRERLEFLKETLRAN